MNLDQLKNEFEHYIMFAAIAGSQAYGTATAGSDEDIRGIYLLPASQYLSLDEVTEQVADARNDIVYYTLKRTLQLACKANPNILELFYMPDDCMLKMTPAMEAILQQRQHFISQQCLNTHIGYAQAQIKKAKGQNKWVNNPQPKMAPIKENFCWIIRVSQISQSELPLRPMSLKQANIDLAKFHCAALEHTQNIYRLYHYGKQAKGVFRNEMLVCESIPKQDESAHFYGLLIYNEAAWKKACQDHEHYWQWRQQRNEKRWQSQEQGVMDYDAKNMMHTVRLLLSGENIISNGEPIVRFSGAKLKLLRDIREGKFEYSELLAMVEDIIHRCRDLQQRCDLPMQANSQVIQKLLFSITKQWQNDNSH